MAKNNGRKKRPRQTPSEPPVPGGAAAENTFDFEAYSKQAIADPKAREAIEFFLEHRHREWEENLASSPDPSIKRK